MALEPGGVDGVLDVLHGREDVLAQVGVLGDELVADGNVAEGDAGEGGDVALDPIVGGGGVGGDGLEVFSGDIEDELDVGSGEGLEDVLVGPIDAHAGDVVRVVEGDSVRRRGEIIADPTVADADAMHTCKPHPTTGI